MKENLKITIKNNNGTEFSYWMHSSGYITITDKDIEDLLKDIEMPFIGEVSPGCYQIGKGMYTGELGFKKFEEELRVQYWANKNPLLKPKMVKLDGKSMKLVAETLLQTKEKVSKKERNI